MPEFIVFKPTVPPRTGGGRLAPRPRTLDGKTVGLLFNSKVNADVYLERVRELIDEKYRGTQVVFHGKATASRAMEPDVLEALRSVDAVVNAFGD
jgi:hypothetical protein